MKFQLDLVLTSLAAFSLLSLPAPSRADGLLQKGDTAHPLPAFQVQTTAGALVNGDSLTMHFLQGGTTTTGTGTFAQPDTANDPGAEVYTFSAADMAALAYGYVLCQPVDATTPGNVINPYLVNLVAVNPYDASLFGLTNIGTLSGQNTLQTGQTNILSKTSLIGTNAADSPNAVAAQGTLGTINTQTSSSARQADMITALTAQGYTVTRSAKIDNLDAPVSSRLATSAYTAPAAPLTVLQIAAAILKTPGNLLATDTNGLVGANNFPAFPATFAASNLPTDYARNNAAPAWYSPLTLPSEYLSTAEQGYLAKLDATISSRLAASGYTPQTGDTFAFVSGGVKLLPGEYANIAAATSSYAVSGPPSLGSPPTVAALALTVVTNTAATQAILTWNSVPGSGYKVLRSVDGQNYTQIGATLPQGTLTYTDAARPAVLHVYYHVVVTP